MAEESGSKNDKRKHRRFTAEQVIKALRKKRGFLAAVAKELGCTRQTVYNYVNRYPTIAQALEEIREERHDWVEGKLLKQIENDNMTAIIFYLKTQAKHRGYVERQEVTGADGDAVVVRVIGGVNLDEDV